MLEVRTHKATYESLIAHNLRVLVRVSFVRRPEMGRGTANPTPWVRTTQETFYLFQNNRRRPPPGPALVATEAPNQHPLALLRRDRETRSLIPEAGSPPLEASHRVTPQWRFWLSSPFANRTTDSGESKFAIGIFSRHGATGSGTKTRILRARRSPLATAHRAILAAPARIGLMAILRAGPGKHRVSEARRGRRAPVDFVPNPNATSKFAM